MILGHGAASERDHLRAAAAVAEEPQFAEEIARAEMSHLLELVAHLDLAVEDHEEPVGVVALVDQPRTSGQLGLAEPAGTALEVGIRQPVEQARFAQSRGFHRRLLFARPSTTIFGAVHRDLVAVRLNGPKAEHAYFKLVEPNTVRDEQTTR